MAKVNPIKKYGGLEQYIEKINSTSWKKSHNNRTCFRAYEDVKNNLLDIQQSVEKGAMAQEIAQALLSYKREIDNIMAQGGDVESKIKKLLSSDPVLFLNDHGPGHINKVIEKANEILSFFSGEFITEHEAFILLCAIQIHDIGNILGRINHEKKLQQIFDEKCKEIIVDTAERRIIKSIAMAHGGYSINGKDTISVLNSSEYILGVKIRTRLLAALLRFSDELADDSTRCSRSSLDLGIIGVNSKIYQDYSRVLHTVKVEENHESGGYKIQLIYELSENDIKEKYDINNFEKYLLDEIYDRTLKVERERRYCMKFIHQCINIEKVEVEINIYGSDCRALDCIRYSLEDVSYPSEPDSGTIKFFVNSIRTGAEELVYLNI